jgi:hypothetical protein
MARMTSGLRKAAAVPWLLKKTREATLRREEELNREERGDDDAL